VQLSSVAAFGFDFPENVDETHPLITNGNSYVDTKITSEHAVLAAHACGEIDCTIIRPGDVYGPASRAWVIVPLEMMRAGQFLLPDRGRGVFSPSTSTTLSMASCCGRARGRGQILRSPPAASFGHHWRWLGAQVARTEGPCDLAGRSRAGAACCGASRNWAAAG
jgi:hypothetical protein